MRSTRFILAAALAAGTAAIQAQPAFRIVAVGDSYASGEGAPDGGNPADWRSSQDGTPERATDGSCHRSSRAWPRLVADGFRAGTGRPVEFTSFACSGAEVPDLVEQEYKGVGQGCGPGLGGQLCELERRFAGKQVDALLVSIGGNDVGFGPTVTHCLLAPDCSTNPPLVEGASNDVAQGEARLAELYRKLAGKIEEINQRGQVTIHNVFLVEYPVPMRDEHGHICNGGRPLPGMPWTRPTADALDTIGAREAKWATEVVIPALNRMVRQGAGLIKDGAGAPYGFYVGGVVERFHTHGYCASNRWINLLRDSIERQGDYPGAVHPNIQGHQAYRDAVLPALRAIVPPAVPQLVIAPTAPPGTQTALTPAGLRLAWQAGGPDITGFQIARRPADAARGVAPAELPAGPRADAFALPPRLPRDGDGGWSITRREGSLQSALLPAPAQASDFAVRACNAAACSPWSRPVRFTPVDGFARRTVQGLQATAAGGTVIRATWNATPAQANTWHQVAYRSAALSGGERISEVPSGAGRHLRGGLPRADFTVAVRECAWSLASPQERAGESCGPWSAPVAVSLKPPTLRAPGLPIGSAIEREHDRVRITRPDFQPIR